MIGVLRAILRRELTLASRIGAGIELGLVFFLILIALAPLSLGPDQKLLSRLAPALLWTGALLATLLGLDRLLQADEEEGVLDQFTLSGAPLELILIVKTLAHWLVTGLPLALIAPLLGLMLAISPAAMAPLALSLLVGTPALAAVGLVGAALTVTLRRGGLLLSVLVLPLTVPTLIFGVALVREAADGNPFSTPLMLLAGTTLIALVVSPIAAAAALRLTRS